MLGLVEVRKDSFYHGKLGGLVGYVEGWGDLVIISRLVSPVSHILTPIICIRN